MFKVGDIVKVIGGRIGDRYKVISVDIDDALILRNINQTHQSMNFMTSNVGHLELDEVHYRKQKLEKICLKLGM